MTHLSYSISENTFTFSSDSCRKSLTQKLLVNFILLYILTDSVIIRYTIISLDLSLAHITVMVLENTQLMPIGVEKIKLTQPRPGDMVQDCIKCGVGWDGSLRTEGVRTTDVKEPLIYIKCCQIRSDTGLL